MWFRVPLLNPPGVLLRIWADLGLEVQAPVGLAGNWIGDEQALRACCDPPLTVMLSYLEADP